MATCASEYETEKSVLDGGDVDQGDIADIDSELFHRIVLAAQRGGKQEIVNLLSEDPCDVKRILCYLCTNRQLLHEACLTGDDELVAVLSGDNYVDINATSPLGSPLSIACQHGYECVVDVLLCNEVGVEVPLPPLTSHNLICCPFYQAAFHGWTNILHILITSRQVVKSNILEHFANCCNLLLSACIGGHESVLEYCLETLPATVDDRALLSTFIENELVAVCLEYSQLHLIPRLITHHAVFTKETCERFESVVGEFLENYLVFESDTGPESQTAAQCVSVGWSGKGLCALRESWFFPFCSVLSDVMLSNNNFPSLPSTLPWAMPNLRNLIVCQCGLRTLSAPLASVGSILCNKLERLLLANNKLESVPVEIFCLTSLLALDISGNELGELSPSIGNCGSAGLALTSKRNLANVLMSGNMWSCVHLKTINLSNNFLETLPDQLQVCGEMETLNLSHNKLKMFIKPWKCPLKWLDLSFNQLSELPLGMDEYWNVSLQVLCVSHNNIHELSQTVCRLESLRELDYSFNKLSNLPSVTWWSCEDLENLNLSGNQFGAQPQVLTDTFLRLKTLLRKTPSNAVSTHEVMLQFPSTIFGIHLTELNLSHNTLHSVPASVCKLTRLARLDLSHNPDLAELPDELCQLVHLEQLYLDGSKLTNLRKHCRELTTRNVLAYLKQKVRKSVPSNRLQLMVVGSQNKGKTTLSFALRGLSAPLDVVTEGVEICEWELKAGLFSSESITVQMWDFAGQRDYYVSHKAFLSSSAIYLIVFDLRLHKEGVASLRPWLSDIQAHAPNSCAIIVGTFLDCLGPDGRSNLSHLDELINQLYAADWCHSRSPVVQYISVSGKTRENIPRLKQLIFDLAKKVQVRVDRSGKENLIGKMVPLDYIKLAEIVRQEAYQRIQLDIWPVLNEQEFLDLVSSIPNNCINTQEELQLAVKYLQEAGYILHFASALRRLKCLYFICPQWLGQMLAKFFSIDGVHKSARAGIIELADVDKFFFKDAAADEIHSYTGNCIDLLESFDIALRIDENRLLLPSKLPAEKPCIQFESSGSCDRLGRLYAMTHVPGGFWSRLLVQLIGAMSTELTVVSEGDLNLVRLRREFIVKDQWQRRSSSSGLKPKITYWQTGICLDCNNSLLFVESAEPFLRRRPTDHAASFSTSYEDGVLVTVLVLASPNSADTDGFVLLALATDHIESLVTQWYPGLQSEGAMERLVPCPHCLGVQTQSDSLRHVKLFPLVDCARMALNMSSNESVCVVCDFSPGQCVDISPVQCVDLPLVHLVPELFLQDVTSLKHMDLKADAILAIANCQLEGYLNVNRDLKITTDVDIKTLGSGGEGVVYKGTLVHDNTPVAIKKNWLVVEKKKLTEYLASCDSGSSRSDDESQRSTSSGLEYYWSSKILEGFGRYRQETTIMSSLQHANIVTLVGVSVPLLAYVMELCPAGNLRELIEQSASGVVPSKIDKRLACKIIFQISSALSYLHSFRIVYKDLKPENVLVWSVKVEDRLNVKLSDYGLAQLVSQQGVMGLEGTSGYQASELRSGRPYNEKVDIFAFGMVIYELMTCASCRGDSSVLRVIRLLDEGRNPLVHKKLLLPQMSGLITSCWSRDSSCRPSASEICQVLEEMAFSSLDKMVCLEADGIRGDCCAMCWIKPCDVRHSAGLRRNKEDISVTAAMTVDEVISSRYLRMWTLSDDLSQYHLFDMDLGQFKVKHYCHLKSEVLCMIAMERLLVVGTQSFLHLLSLERDANKMVERSLPLQTEDTPLMLVAGAQDTREFFVGFKQSGLRKYLIDESNSIVPLHENLLPPETTGPVSCALWVKDELWVGSGASVAIFCDNVRRSEVQPVFCEPLLVSSMFCHGDQVWVLAGRGISNVVVELDACSRCIVCVLDCSTGVFIDHCLAVFDYPQTLRGRLAEQKDCDVEEQLRDRFGGGARIVRQKLSSHSRRQHRVKKTGNEVDGGTQLVTAAAYVNGVLWVALTSREILLVNVTKKNGYEYDYGQIVAKLCPSQEGFYQVTWGVVYEIVFNGRQVVTVHKPRDSESQATWNLVKWTAVGLETVFLHRNV